MVRLEHYNWTITPAMRAERPFNLRRSRVDGKYRMWQQFRYSELGLTDETPEKTATVWICVDQFDSKAEAIKNHTGLLDT